MKTWFPSLPRRLRRTSSGVSTGVSTVYSGPEALERGADVAHQLVGKSGGHVSDDEVTGAVIAGDAPVTA